MRSEESTGALDPSKRQSLPWGAFASVLLFALLAMLFVKHGELVMRVSCADEQTQIFEEMREQALQSELPAAVQYLEYAVWYYPSGTKQTAGSRLDWVVERARSAAVREIIGSLRTKSREDLGHDPKVWIDRFKKRT